MDFEQFDRILSYDSDTGIFRWKERPNTGRINRGWNKKHAGKQTGYVRRNGYMIVRIGDHEFSAARVAWLLTYKEWPKGEVDHISGDKLDNRIINLRIATRSENATNKGPQANNSSGYKGVWKRKNLNRWVAEIQKNGKRTKLGSFGSPEEAYEVYKKAARELHGEFATV